MLATTTEIVSAPPASFTEVNGNWFGTTTDGTPFSEVHLTENLVKFTIGDSEWLIEDGEIIYYLGL